METSSLDSHYDAGRCKMLRRALPVSMWVTTTLVTVLYTFFFTQFAVQAEEANDES